ncbi:MAG TPA: HDOD domain-containing protein [Phycisphaerae bacterium]|nr:HDOD domain-containing protein [Phycisphaerae bacterium]HNU45790.1 HDOD domain-containing protein [Phycisphaerae bacterium]
MNAKVLEAIKRSAAVPSMPQVVSRFLEIMQDPNFDYADVVKVLSADAGTVGEILRLVNSALFGVRQKVASLRQALTLLGPKRTRSLLLGRYLVDALGGKSVGGLDMSYFWRRSLTSSVIGSRLADVVQPRSRDEVFIAALLADIGIPILAEALPEQYRPLLTRYTPNGGTFTPAEEQTALEVTHAEVSAMVLAHWSLPDAVYQAVNLHQSDSPGQGEVPTIARILNASDRIARLLCEIPDMDAAVRACREATTFIGVELNVLNRLLTTVESDIEELAGALRIDVVSSNVYTLIAKAVQDHLATPVPVA